MPTIPKDSQVRQKGLHTKRQIAKIQPQAIARDRLSNAFAGDENEGPHKDPRATVMHSTSVKSRRTKKSKLRIPKR